ncbi:hypothetical protein COBT_001023 [Conglomerata obtusa]
MYSPSKHEYFHVLTDKIDPDIKQTGRDLSKSDNDFKGCLYNYAIMIMNFDYNGKQKKIEVSNFSDRKYDETFFKFINELETCMDGIFPPYIIDTIKYLTAKNILFDLSCETVKMFWKCLPFTICGERRDLLLNFLKFWKVFNATEFMNYDGFLIYVDMFGQSILPQSLVNNKNFTENIIEFLIHILCLDYKHLDSDLFYKFLLHDENKDAGQ